jgi:transcriptional regulator with XRE-family HTH domain
MSIEKYRKLLREVEEDPEYWVRLSAFEFVHGLQRLLDEERMTRAKLAKRAGVKPSVVSRALRGDANLTLRMMNKLASVVDAAVRIHVERRAINGVWVPLAELAGAAVTAIRDLESPTAREHTPDERNNYVVELAASTGRAPLETGANSA